jgi:tRNA-2-methylthio-N6-dimethylallyladenosine synthase
MAYIAKFSPRPGTVAEKIGDNVSQKEKERRYKILTNLLKKFAKKKNEKFLNKVVDVLVEKENEGILSGKSRHFKTIKFEGDKSLVGNFVKVKILKALDFGLEGKLEK